MHRWLIAVSMLRVRVETPGPPELGKERTDGKLHISVARPHPNTSDRAILFSEAEEEIQAAIFQKYVR